MPSTTKNSKQQIRLDDLIKAGYSTHIGAGDKSIGRKPSTSSKKIILSIKQQVLNHQLKQVANSKDKNKVIFIPTTQDTSQVQYKNLTQKIIKEHQQLQVQQQ